MLAEPALGRARCRQWTTACVAITLIERVRPASGVFVQSQQAVGGVPGGMQQVHSAGRRGVWMGRVRGAIGGCQQLLQKERGNQRKRKVFKAPDLCRIDTVVGSYNRKGEVAGQWQLLMGKRKADEDPVAIGSTS